MEGVRKFGEGKLNSSYLLGRGPGVEAKVCEPEGDGEGEPVVELRSIRPECRPMFDWKDKELETGCFCGCGTTRLYLKISSKTRVNAFLSKTKITGLNNWLN